MAYPYQTAYQNPYGNYAQQNYNVPNTNPIVWVQGEAGAKAYPVAAGTSVLLMDSETQCFYIKSTDASGVPMPLRIFEYTEKKQNVAQNAPIDFNPTNYVTQDEFNELKAQIDTLISKSTAKKTTEAK